ncbi:MAG: DeoR/GlpR transcriptional regulator [Spirochaetales bacterium]|nr:DeoR/GlpR transcriptional regulator [Spirochaetales bacterium]
MNRRQRKIIDCLGADSMTPVSELAAKLGVSAVTIRQDLNYLEAEGFLKRVHGGAVLQDADDISKRLIMNYDRKLAIARKAAGFVSDNDTILIESGSTNAILVKELGRKGNANIITTNVFIARELKKNAQANIILLGGYYQHESESLVGQLTKLCLEHVNFSKAFVGVDGYTIDSGFTSTDMMRAEISALIVEKSREVFVLTDSSKFGKVQLASLFYPKDITCLITDGGIPERERGYLEEQGVQVCIV